MLALECNAAPIFLRLRRLGVQAALQRIDFRLGAMTVENLGPCPLHWHCFSLWCSPGPSPFFQTQGANLRYRHEDISLMTPKANAAEEESLFFVINVMGPLGHAEVQFCKSVPKANHSMTIPKSSSKCPKPQHRSDKDPTIGA